jgi:hypothetical protein
MAYSQMPSPFDGISCIFSAFLVTFCMCDRSRHSLVAGVASGLDADDGGLLERCKKNVADVSPAQVIVLVVSQR